jgi:glutamate dehydrogenase (NADP+)
MSESSYITELKAAIEKRNPNQPEFMQAVTDILDKVADELLENEEYRRYRIFERLTVPDRVIEFKVEWLDDAGNAQINTGWRVQQSNLIGPYKGGLRFHPSVSESVVKFLAFEQCFKNALTGLPLGGGKGGSDFDPRNRSDHEIMSFCQAFMTQLYRHIGANVDVPAGDINVGAREIGYLYGQYRKIKNQFSGVLTGKALGMGGSLVRTEATGYGTIYFLQHVLEHQGLDLKGLTLTVSGAGNVALYASQKAIEKGAKVITLSNSRGLLYKEQGFSQEDIDWLIKYDNVKNNTLAEFVEEHEGEWRPGEKPWQMACDVAVPCATQNELDANDAKMLINNGCKVIVCGANMPCTADAMDVIRAADSCTYIPGKASNAGGVAVSGLEMSQNAGFESQTFEYLDCRLQEIMKHIHQQCMECGKSAGKGIDYERGASIAGFHILAKAMLAQGV